MRRRQPTVAVWKFSSCDGCQLSLLDCEDELLALAERDRDRLLPRGVERDRRGPLRRLARRGLDHHRRTTPSASARSARSSRALVTIGACATAGGIQALRNFADVDEFARIVYASPDYTQHAAHLDADQRARAGRLRAATGCPIDKRPAARGDRRAPAAPPPARAGAQRVRRVQAARHRVRDGRARHAVPGPGHARRLRRDLPLLRPRLLRLLRPDGEPEHRRR